MTSQLKINCHRNSPEEPYYIILSKDNFTMAVEDEHSYILRYKFSSLEERLNMIKEKD